MMKSRRLWLLAPLVSVVGGCTYYVGHCYVHCWEYRVEHDDIQDADEDNYYDSQCDNFHGGTMNAPIPAQGVPGRECLGFQGQSVHETIKAVIAAKLADDLESLSQAQIDTYNLFVFGGGVYSLVPEVTETCVNLLTCNKKYCDIDEGATGTQACTLASAQGLCETYVESVAEAALDLDTGPDVPTYGVPDWKYYNLIEDPECDYVAEETGTGGGGLDESGGGMQSDPFGDIDELVYCSPQTECTIEQELVDNIKLNSDVFADEGVGLTFGSWPEGSGVKISGLSAGDYSKELADELDLRNNDVITHVNGTALTSGSLETLANELTSIHFSGYVELTLERRASSTLTYKIHLVEFICMGEGMACTSTSDCCSSMVCSVNDECVWPV